MPLGEGEPKPEALLKEGMRKPEAPRPKDRQKASEPNGLLREVSRKDTLSSWGEQALRRQEGGHVGKDSSIQ